MLKFQNIIANDLRSAGKLASASRPSRGRPSFNTTVKEPLKKHRTPTLPGLSNDTRFDKLITYSKRRTGYSFIKCQKHEVALFLQKVRNCFTIYHTERSLDKISIVYKTEIYI